MNLPWILILNLCHEFIVIFVTCFFRYYTYASSGNTDSDLAELQAHIDHDAIKMVYIYSKPLNESQWTNVIFFHAYVVFYTETPNGVTFWWSLEKNLDCLILQMSTQLEDVRDKCEGGRRISEATSWYWKPKLNIQDVSAETFKDLYSFIIVESDQLSINYRLEDNNCKKFAKSVFDRAARNKVWKYKENGWMGIYI